MKHWKNKFLTLIDNASNQVKNAVDSVNEMVSTINWDAQTEYFEGLRESLMRKTNDWYDDFNHLLKQVKENLTDFSVTVPFDELSGENLEYKVENGKLIVKVTYADEFNERDYKTSVLIPKNCDCSRISYTTNNALKIATITIPKVNVIKQDEEKRVVKHKKVARKKNKNAASENVVNTSKKVKLHRAPNGRFVSKEE